MPHSSIIVASGSQDYTIRLTRIFPLHSSSSSATAPSIGTFGQKIQAFPSVSIFPCSSLAPHPFACELYSVLRSHTDWVHSVRWLTSSPFPSLFSASADKSIALWREGADGVWCETRAGRIGGGVMSFCGGACTSSGDCLVAHSHTGAIHMWLRAPNSSAEEAAADHQPWTPTPTPSGHFAPVSDLKVPPPLPPSFIPHACASGRVTALTSCL